MTEQQKPAGKYDGAIAELTGAQAECKANIELMEEAIKTERAELREINVTLARLKKLNGESDTPEADNSAE